MEKNVLIFFVLICNVFTLEILYEAQIDIASLNKCNANSDYLITVENVRVRIENSKYLVSGILSTKVDLMSPLKATLKVEKKELGIWLPVPCIDEVGSCTYEDLCIHGVPKNTSCPSDYLKSGVPCRCPIPQGNYTLNEVEQNLESVSIVSGKYYAKITVEYNNKMLSCYEIYFTLNTNTKKIPEDIPFVEIVY